jgi:hypothetical protein
MWWDSREIMQIAPLVSFDPHYFFPLSCYCARCADHLPVIPIACPMSPCCTEVNASCNGPGCHEDAWGRTPDFGDQARSSLRTLLRFSTAAMMRNYLQEKVHSLLLPVLLPMSREKKCISHVLMWYLLCIINTSTYFVYIFSKFEKARVFEKRGVRVCVFDWGVKKIKEKVLFIL